MNQLPYFGSVTVNAILGNNDLGIDEKAYQIRRFAYDQEAQYAKDGKPKNVMSIREIKDILIEMER